MPNIYACSHQNQPLSESLSMINRKSPLSSMKKRIGKTTSCQPVIDNACADGHSLLIGCLNIFGPNSSLVDNILHLKIA